MNEKLTIQDLVELLVNRHEVSQEDADVFGVFLIDRTSFGH